MQAVSRWFCLFVIIALCSVIIPPGGLALAQGGEEGSGPDIPVDEATQPELNARECGQSRKSSPFKAPLCNDTTFVIDAGASLDTGCKFRSGGPLRFSIGIDRYLGDLAKLKANRLISPLAILRMPAYDVDYTGSASGNQFPERDRVTFNGEELGYLSGSNGAWKLNTFTIPIEKLKLPADGGPGSTLQPAVNTIQIDIDVANTREVWCTAIDWATLSIDVPQPALAVHGILSSGEPWETTWMPRLRALGIPGDTITMGGFAGIPLDSIQNNAEKIGVKVEALKKRWGVDKINIVSHSKGGIDSRHYAEDHDTVGVLAQIGTPNAGSPLADYAQIASILILSAPRALLVNLALPAGYQLTRPYMRLYNFFHGPNPETRYVSLAGDYRSDEALSIEGALGAILSGPDDTIVPVSSVHALDYASHLTYSSSGPNKQATHTGQIGSPDIYQMLAPYLTALKRNTTSEVALSSFTEPASLAATIDEMNPTQTIVGSIARGQTKSYTMVVDSASAAGFMLTHAAGDLRVTLTSPTGASITPGTTSAASGTFYNVISDVEGLKAVAYVINNPAPGIWQLTLTAPSVSADGEEEFYLTGLVKGAALSLTADTDRPYYKVNDPVVIRARLTSPAPPTGATVAAQVALPDNTLVSVVLSDNGGDSDGVANDGIYSGRLTNTAQSGLYRVLVTASRDNPSPFRREALIQTTVSSSVSTFRTPFSSSGKDTDRDGLYNQLVVTARVNVAQAGSYRIVGVLKDKNGKVIDTRASTVSLAAGLRAVALGFSGERIYANRVDGPFTLSVIRLAEDTGAQLLPLQELTDAHITAAYAYTRFQRPGIQLPRTGRDVGVDTNNNRLYNFLDVSLDVEVLKSGSYEWTGLLTDESGREIAFASNTGRLVAGANTITFRFNGTEIQASGVNSRYILRSLLIYGGSDTAVVFEAYSTRAYRAAQFERDNSVFVPMIRR